MLADTPRKGLGLGTKILIGMAAGAVLGAFLGERVSIVEPVGDVFIRLLIMAAVPLVFFNLLAGLTTLTDLRTFGRLASRILVFFVLTTVLALVLGLVAMALVRPGDGVVLRESVDREVGAAPSVLEILTDLVPTNIFAAFAEGNVTQLVVVSVLLGIATLLLPEGPRDRLRAAFADLADLFRKVVDLILLVAPYGIGALMAVTVGRYGAELFGPMAGFLAGVWGAQVVLVALYLTMLRALSDRGPVRFLRETGAVWATTLSTTSSLASLSVSLDVAEQIDLPRPVYAFTLPLGAQINKDGTAIMLMAVVMFTAQAAGVQMTPAEIFTLLLMGVPALHGIWRDSGRRVRGGAHPGRVVRLAVGACRRRRRHLSARGHGQYDGQRHGRHDRNGSGRAFGGGEPPAT